MYKQCQVVMLPTNQKATVYRFKETNKLIISNHPNQKNEAISQELYILSDDEIKEGDWCYNIVSKTKFQASTELIKLINDPNVVLTTNKKIIATTDNQCYVGYPMRRPHESFINYFITDYNAGNIITNVMVEYDELKSMNQRNIIGSVFKLKINADNTINIKLAKDSWSREEHEDGLKLAFKAGCEYVKSFKHGIPSQPDFDEWIKQNL